jgi:GT2 family glycosyltransferase
LLLNSDVVLEEDAVLALMKTLESCPACGVLGPVILHGAEPDRVLTAGNGDPVFSRNHALGAPLHEQAPFPVTFVSGAVALIRIRLLEQVGLLDERFFFGLELADLCLRARKKGFSTLVDPGVRVHHHVERATSLRDSLYVYYVVRNRFLYMRKHHRILSPVLLAAWSAHGVQQAFRLRRQGRRATARAIMLGVTDGLRGRYGGQNQRVLALCQKEGQAG